MVWILIKALFNREKFKKTLSNFTIKQIKEYKQRAVSEENYELAAYLDYYLAYKESNHAKTT